MPKYTVRVAYPPSESKLDDGIFVEMDDIWAASPKVACWYAQSRMRDALGAINFPDDPNQFVAFQKQPDKRLFEIVWYQELLVMAGRPVTPEVLVDDIEEDQLPWELAQQQLLFMDAVGVRLVTRPKNVQPYPIDTMWKEAHRDDAG